MRKCWLFIFIYNIGNFLNFVFPVICGCQQVFSHFSIVSTQCTFAADAAVFRPKIGIFTVNRHFANTIEKIVNQLFLFFVGKSKLSTVGINSPLHKSFGITGSIRKCVVHSVNAVMKTFVELNSAAFIFFGSQSAFHFEITVPVFCPNPVN